VSRASTFRAWRLPMGAPRNEATALAADEQVDLRTFRDAVVGMSCFNHKDVLIIEEAHQGAAKRTVHFYVIRRRSTATRTWDADKQSYVSFHPLYTQELLSLAVDTFVPIEPWQWIPGADVVGRDRDLIEQDSK